MRHVVAPLLLVAVLSLAPATGGAQSFSVLAGRFVNEDGSLESVHRSYGLRVDHRPARLLLLEAGVQYANVHLVQFGANDLTLKHAAPRYTVDVQAQLQLPLGPVRPYVGVGAGLFTYRQLPTNDAGYRPRLTGTTRLHTFGIRADDRRRWSLRGELRLRFDDPAFGYFPFSGEWVGGLGYRW